MYERFIYYIIIPIMLGILIAVVASGSKRDRAEAEYYVARTHKIIHELHEKGCESVKYLEEFRDE